MNETVLDAMATKAPKLHQKIQERISDGSLNIAPEHIPHWILWEPDTYVGMEILITAVMIESLLVVTDLYVHDKLIDVWIENADVWAFG
jgi:hypothetical protein